MSKAQRYDHGRNGMIPNESGHWYQSSDYARLEAEAQTLRDEVAALREAHDKEWRRAGMAEENLKAALRERVVVVQDWQQLTGAGQIAKGDLLRFTVAGKEIEAPAQLIINAGTAKEEIVYNRGKNHYFITGMAVDGTSSHKSVMVKRLNGKAVSEGLLREAKRHLGNWLELHCCECEGGLHYCGRDQVAKTHRELRALLGEGKEVSDVLVRE